MRWTAPYFGRLWRANRAADERDADATEWVADLTANSWLLDGLAGSSNGYDIRVWRRRRMTCRLLVVPAPGPSSLAGGRSGRPAWSPWQRPQPETLCRGHR